jgi:hypothetical protein
MNIPQHGTKKKWSKQQLLTFKKKLNLLCAANKPTSPKRQRLLPECQCMAGKLHGAGCSPRLLKRQRTAGKLSCQGCLLKRPRVSEYQGSLKRQRLLPECQCMAGKLHGAGCSPRLLKRQRVSGCSPRSLKRQRLPDTSKGYQCLSDTLPYLNHLTLTILNLDKQINECVSLILDRLPRLYTK